MNQEILSLCQAYQKYFDIGAAISPPSLTMHADLLKKHFNSITCENQMKYESMHPAEDKWIFEPADQIVAFAKENGMRMRMHAPVWHNQTPKWFFEANGRLAPRELVFERMEQHIKVVAERYRDAVYSWDVVNEATADTVDERFLRRYGNNPYRLTDYLVTCGVEYLEKAYHLARKYAPHVQLFYNDYNECDPLKRERIYNLMKNLIDRGAPIQGFGMQTHYNINKPDLDEVKKSIEFYASLGLRIHITEMDINFYTDVHSSESAIEITDAMREKQNEIYVKLFEIYRSYSDVIDSVTTWGVADDYSWLSRPDRPNYPLLFNADHSPKPCVYKMIDDAVAGR